MYPGTIDPLQMFEVADDFHNLDIVKWSSVDDAGTGTNTANAVPGGEVSIVTAGADNDYHIMKAATAHFKIVAGKPIWFVARLSLTEANTDDANICLGISSVVDATLFTVNGAGPPASYSGCLFFKVDGGTVWQFETSLATAQTTNSNLAPFTSGVVYQVGFVVDSGDGTTALVTPWIYNETTGVRYVGAPHKLTIAAQAVASLVYGVAAGGANVETLKLDYIRCAQKR